METRFRECLHDCLFPVLLGSGTLSHACVRRFWQQYRVNSTVLTGRRALTLRFLPNVKLVNAPPRLADDILLCMLYDAGEVGYGRIPLLVLCDEAYRGFVRRNRAEIERRFVFREARELFEGEEDFADGSF